jgi:uncharacterized protein YoxC
VTEQDFMWLAIGLASLVVAGALAFALVRLAAVLGRADEVLGKVEEKLEKLEPQLTEALGHVGGIAGNVDTMVGRVNKITEAAEKTVGVVSKTADAAQQTITPAVVRFVGVLAGLGEGARMFFGTRHKNGPTSKPGSTPAAGDQRKDSGE